MTFMPDNWAIDWVAVSFDSAESVQKTLIKPSNIVGVRGNKLSQVEGLLDDKDRDYFITYPGDRYRLEFSVDEVAAGIQRTYFVSSSGYYIEWLRMNWIEENESYGPKIPLKLNDELLKRTAKRWLERRNTMESQFYGSRLPFVQ
jgi:hypothetical protein